MRLYKMRIENLSKRINDTLILEKNIINYIINIIFLNISFLDLFNYFGDF